MRRQRSASPASGGGGTRAIPAAVNLEPGASPPGFCRLTEMPGYRTPSPMIADGRFCAPMSDPAPQWLLNNHHGDNHAELFGDGMAFFDLDKGERYDRYDIKAGDQCVVATPQSGTDVKFCWFTFSREEPRKDPRQGKDGKVRVLFGKLKSEETLTKAAAAAEPKSPYRNLFNDNGDFKAGWSILRGETSGRGSSTP